MLQTPERLLSHLQHCRRAILYCHFASCLHFLLDFLTIERKSWCFTEWYSGGCRILTTGWSGGGQGVMARTIFCWCSTFAQTASLKFNNMQQIIKEHFHTVCAVLREAARRVSAGGHTASQRASSGSDGFALQLCVFFHSLKVFFGV